MIKPGGEVKKSANYLHFENNEKLEVGYRQLFRYCVYNFHYTLHTLSTTLSNGRYKLQIIIVLHQIQLKTSAANKTHINIKITEHRQQVQNIQTSWITQQIAMGAFESLSNCRNTCPFHMPIRT
jgi:hypothetical protein